MKNFISGLLLLALCTNLKSQVSTTSLCAGGTGTLYITNYYNLQNINAVLNPGNISSSNGIFVVSPTVTTTYSIVTTGSSPNTTVTSQTELLTVLVNAQPSAAVTLTQSSCSSIANGFNLGLSFFPAAPTPSYSIFWLANGGPNARNPIPNGINSNTQTSASNVQPGLYIAQINTGECMATATVNLLPPPMPARILLSPNTTAGYTINCYQPTLNIAANDPLLNYTWGGTNLAPVSGASISLNAQNAGAVVITATNPVSGCTASRMLTIVVNTIQPIATITPSIQNVTCNLSSITSETMTAQSPTLGFTHQIQAPGGAIYLANSFTASYLPMAGAGTYTYSLMNNANGCAAIKTFTVNSSQGYPTGNLVSTPAGYTVGCSSKSVCALGITNAVTQPIPGGAVSYTLLPPGSSTLTPSGSLGSQSAYTVSNPGTYTLVIKDNTSLCESRMPLTILQNTFQPGIDSLIITNVLLTCSNPSTALICMPSSTNTSVSWIYGSPSTTAAVNSITVNNTTAPATNTLLGPYSVVVTDNNNLCKTQSLVAVYRNVFLPNTNIAASANAITCSSPSLVLTNSSSSGVPPNGFFPMGGPVVASLWTGVSPQLPSQLSSTYQATAPGVYTLTGTDISNGCTNTKTIIVSDNRIYPAFQPDGNYVNILCPGLTAFLTPTVLVPFSGLSYSWTVPPNANVSGVNTNILLINGPGMYTVTVTNTLTGCASSMVYTAVVCANVRQFQPNQSSFELFPNPGNGAVTIKAGEHKPGTEIRVTDALGREVLRQEVMEGALTINLQNQARGVYFVVLLQNGNTRGVRRFIKQ